MDNKICWIDVETTGLDKVKQDVIQIAGIVDINGQVVEEFEFKCQPHNWDDIQQRALEVHGYSGMDLQGFPAPHEVKEQVCAVLKRHCNPFDKKDKMTFAGYNSPFDYGFVKEWFVKAGDKYFNSFFYSGFGYHSRLIDTYPDFMNYARAAGLNLENNKLVTAAAHFGIEFKAHDAMGDIRATREIDQILKRIYKLGINAYLEEQGNAPVSQ